jgi:hypothetical protein
MARISFQSKQYAGGAMSWMWQYIAHYRWGIHQVITVGPHSSEEAAKSDAQGLADQYELENDPGPNLPKKKQKD